MTKILLPWSLIIGTDLNKLKLSRCHSEQSEVITRDDYAVMLTALSAFFDRLL